VRTAAYSSRPVSAVARPLAWRKRGAPRPRPGRSGGALQPRSVVPPPPRTGRHNPFIADGAPFEGAAEGAGGEGEADVGGPASVAGGCCGSSARRRGSTSALGRRRGGSILRMANFSFSEQKKGIVRLVNAFHVTNGPQAIRFAIFVSMNPPYVL
jgi:hypothetical protein